MVARLRPVFELLRTRPHWVIAALFGALGVVDVVLRFCLVANNVAAIAHDPGKTLFHIVLLPLVVIILGDMQSNNRFHSYPRPRPPFIAKLALFGLMLLAAWAGVNETRGSFYDRLKSPEDIGPQPAREMFAKFRAELMQQQFRSANWSESHAKRARDQSSVAANCLVRLSAIDMEDAGKVGDCLNANHENQKISDSSSSNGDENEGVLSKISQRRWSAASLVIAGNMTVAYLMWLIFTMQWRAVSNPRQMPLRRELHALTAAVVVLALWVPLSLYSEYWRNFGTWPESNPALLLGLITSLGAFAHLALLCICVIGLQESKPWIQLAIAAVSGGSSFLLASGQHEALVPAFKQLLALSPVEMVTMLATLTIFLLNFLWVGWRVAPALLDTRK